MDVMSAFLLGAVQGLTEFFPISSSGHLVLSQNTLGFKEPEVFFDICLHIGSLIAIFAVFWKDIMGFALGGVRLPLALFRRERRLAMEERAFLFVFLGSIPTALIGLLAKDFLESMFASIPAVSINLLITGTFLWFTRYSSPRNPKNIGRMHWMDAVVIGCAQGLAIAPGISRSGATISCGLFLGMERDLAVRFSFLLVIPALLGAFVLEGRHADFTHMEFLPVFVGAGTAALTGYITLKILLRTVRKGSIFVFAPYCWLLGAVGLAVSLLHR
jgi:undecaprenyl-diphosphatase